MKPKSIPKRVRIFGTWHKVKLVSAEEVQEFLEAEQPNKAGAIDHENKVILLNKDQPDGPILETYVHELIHGKMYESGVDDLIDSHFDSETSVRVKEAIVCLLTAAEFKELKKAKK